jgi:hypothetical protein
MYLGMTGVLLATANVLARTSSIDMHFARINQYKPGVKLNPPAQQGHLQGPELSNTKRTTQSAVM